MDLLRRIYAAYLGLLWDLDGWLTRLWHRRRVRIGGSCSACGACCRRLVLWSAGSPVRDAAGFAALLERDAFTYERFVPVDRNADGDLLFDCTKLGRDGRCTVHARRPVLCRRYPEPRMFLGSGGSLPQECSYSVVLLARDLT